MQFQDDICYNITNNENKYNKFVHQNILFNVIKGGKIKWQKMKKTKKRL